MSVEITRQDITRRNAGTGCLVVWSDGTWEHCGTRDAELYSLTQPGDVVLVVRLDVMEAVTFRPHEDRINLHEKLLIRKDES